MYYFYRYRKEKINAVGENFCKMLGKGIRGVGRQCGKKKKVLKYPLQGGAFFDIMVEEKNARAGLRD